MKRINLTDELILLVNSDNSSELCKSRFFTGSFINSDTGELYSKRKAYSYLYQNTRFQVMHTSKSRMTINRRPAEDKEAIIKAMNNLDYLNDGSLNWLNTNLESWLFFNEELPSGELVNCRHLHECFCLLEPCTEKAFYQKLKQWAAENQYKLTFKNILKNRKVILEL